MIGDHLRVVGVQTIHLAIDETFSVTFLLSDGSTSTTHWLREDLHRFLNVHEDPKHAPVGSIIN